MATLQLDIQSNAVPTLAKIESHIDRTSAKAEKLKKDFAGISMSVPAGGLSGLSSYSTQLAAVGRDMLRFAGLAYTYFANINSEFEQSRIMMRNVTGSVEAGNKAFDDMLNLTEKVPFSIDAISNTFVKLKGAGIKEAAEYTRVLADSVTAFGGNSEKLKLVSIAIMQMAGKGVISMEELKRQFGEQVPTAIRIMEEQLRKTGKLMENMPLIDFIKTGKLGSKTGITALMEGLTEAYLGVGADRMNSYAGSLVLFENQFKRLMDDLGNGTGLFKDITVAIQSAARQLKMFRESDAGMKTIRDLAFQIAAGFKKITENPEIIYEFFRSIGEAATTAAVGFEYLIRAINTTLSVFDLVTGKVSAGSMMLFKDDITKYSSKRGALIDRTEAQSELEKRYLKDSNDFVAAGNLEAIAPEGMGVAFGGLFNKLTGIDYGGKYTKEEALARIKKAEDELAGIFTSSKVDIEKDFGKTGKGKVYEDFFDIIGSDKNKSSKEMSALNKELSRYKDNMAEAIKATDKWNDSATKSVGDMQDLIDEYSNFGKSQGEIDHYENNRRFLEGQKSIVSYKKTLEELPSAIKYTQEALQQANDEYAIMGGKLGRVAGANSFDVINKLDTLSDKREQLTALLAEQLDLQGQLNAIEKSGGFSEKDLADAINLEQKKKYYIDYIGEFGADSKQLYNFFADLYQKDAVVFEQYTGSKEMAAKMFNRSMRDMALSSPITGWAEAIGHGFNMVSEDAEVVADDIAHMVTGAFDEATDALTEFVRTGKLSFSDLADSIVRDLARIYIQKAIVGPLSKAIGGIFGGDLGMPKGNLEAAKGAVVSGISSYRNSVVDRPTYFSFNDTKAFARGGLMGEAGAEAIVPLKRSSGGSLGVDASGLGGVVVNVNNNVSGVQARAEVVNNGNGGKSIEIMIDEVVAKNMSRYGSASSKAMTSRGVGQPLTRR